MANSFGTTPQSQPQTTMDLDAFTIGITKVICDGSWLGAIREGTAVELNINPLDKDIMAAQFPGTALGVRQLGESPTLTFECVENTLRNVKKFIDFQAALVGGSSLAFGRRNAKATEHTLTCYSEGHQQQTRRMHLYRVVLAVDGAINWASPEEFTGFKMVAKILPDMNVAEDQWYGVIDEYVS